MKNKKILALICSASVLFGTVSMSAAAADSSDISSPAESDVQPELYSITYQNGGGNGRIDKTEPVPAGEKVKLSPWALRRDGYSHAGWTDGENEYERGEEIIMPEKDIVLRPVWNRVYMLTYEKLEDYGYTSPYRDGTVSPGSDIYLPNLPMHNGNAMFNGWLVNGEHVNPASTIKMPAQDTYIAVDWREPIVFDYYAGDVEGVLGPAHYITDKYPGLKMNLSDNTRRARLGYRLVGWYDPVGDRQYDPGDTFLVPDRDVTMLAVWKPNKVNMRFNPNGGEGTMNSQIEYFDSVVNISECTFTREGYKLHGWKNGDDYYLPGAEVTVKIAELGAFMEFDAVWIEEDRNPGDINRDGKVDLCDLTELNLHLIGDSIITDKTVLDDADVEYDGDVNLSDLARLRQFLTRQKILLGIKGEQ